MSKKRRRAIEVLCAIGATASVASYFLVFRSGESLHYGLYYNTPIAAPFAAFMVQLLYPRTFAKTLPVDLFVVGLALARAFLPMPGYSGHVLFLAYALLSRLGIVRVLAALVLAEVLFVKLFLWSDWITPIGALLLTAVALRIRRGALSVSVSAIQTVHVEQGPYRTEIHNASTERASLLPATLLFAALTLVVTVVWARNNFSADRWQADPGGLYADERTSDYRTVRAAAAATWRLRGASAEDACDLLGGHACPPVEEGIVSYEMSEACIAPFSMTPCYFQVQLENRHVVAAWLHDSDGAPWSIECLHGCGREDMRARVSAH
ncbi:MAG: hypothetical protein AB8H86_09255 [Polyangiales bacterium]